MTPEEYRALAERLAKQHFGVEFTDDRAPEGTTGWCLACGSWFPCDPGEASAALPALLDANEALRALNLERQATIEEYDRQQRELVIHRDALAREWTDARAEVAALGAQLADATTITDEMVERAAICLAPLISDRPPSMWLNLHHGERVAATECAKAVLAAALSGASGVTDAPSDESLSLDSSSVPAVPEEKDMSEVLCECGAPVSAHGRYEDDCPVPAVPVDEAEK